MEKTQTADTAALKKAFLGGRSASSPYIYLPLDPERDLTRREKISKLFVGHRKSGFLGVIPFTNDNFAVTPLSLEYFDAYRMIAEEARANDLSLGYLDDTYVMREYLALRDDKNEICCRVLSLYETACTEKQKTKIKLKKTGVRMSLCAVNDDDLTILDLREFAADDILEWTPPVGNWNVMEFVCEPDPLSHYVNLMDYKASSEYLRETLDPVRERIAADGEEPFSIFIYRNVLFAGKNRRMWDTAFNERFAETYGFDPAPYYPLLFRDFAGESRRYKAMLQSCRSKMLTDGYLKAAADICAARGIFCTGFPAESKATFCSWLFGDGQFLHRFASAPGISMPFAYLYGLNGVKVASGAADQFGSEILAADLFKYFKTLTKDIIYRESMNAFVRGVNMVFAHLGEDRTHEETDIVENEAGAWGSIFSKGDDLSDFAGYVTRVQSLLRGGEHVCEAAIVYPIHSLHSYV